MARTFVAASSQVLTRASVPIAAPPFTMACWFKPANIAGASAKALMSLDDGAGATAYHFLFSDGTTGRCAVASSGAGTSTSAAAAVNGAWSHHTGVWASTASRTAYLDGVAATPDVAAATPTVTTTNIGRLWAVALYADGAIAEAAIWNVALSALEISMLAAGVSPLMVRPSALVSYWPLVHGYSPEIDLVGHYDLTLTGATVSAHPRIYHPALSGFVPRAVTNFHIVGVTKNSAGATLGGCTVRLFRSSDNLLIATTTSDGAGAYSFSVGNTSTPYYVVAYKAGSPDVAGTTINTLVGV